MNVCLVAAKSEDALIGGRVPDDDVAIHTAEGDAGTVRAAGDRVDSPAVTGHACHLVSGRCIPGQDLALVGTG